VAGQRHDPSGCRGGIRLRPADRRPEAEPEAAKAALADLERRLAEDREALEKALLERGAREVRTVVLIRRLLEKPTFVPCWVGFQYPGPEWFVGYGMDDNERWRNLPGVHVIKRDV
jgi:hypothetical protein